MELAQDFYGSLLKKKLRASLALFFPLLFLIFTFLVTGSYDINFSALLSAIFGRGEDTVSHIVWQIRIPRLLSATLSGAGLGIAGCVLQNVLKNPLVSPFTLGLSQGAAFGASFAIIVLGAGMQHRVGEGVTIFSYYPTLICAFSGSLISMSLILLVSSLRGATKEVVVLSGIAISAFFSALTMFIQYFAEDVQVAASVFWTFGDIGKGTWNNIPLIAIAFALSFSYLMFRANDLNALKWGDDVARTLGVSSKGLRIKVLLVTSLLTSVITSFLGIIAFVGLLAPHFARLLIGEDERFLIPTSASLGSIILILSDVIARKVVAPNVLPVGIVTSFFGAPFFIYLMMRARGGN